MAENDLEPVKSDPSSALDPTPSSSQNGEEQKPREGNDMVIGSAAIRPIFLGNLKPEYTAEDITRIFENPSSLSSLDRTFREFPVDHIDLKRGFCFVFLKDADTESYKNDAVAFIEAINGM